MERQEQDAMTGVPRTPKNRKGMAGQTPRHPC